VSSLQEIELAIGGLSTEDRAKLVRDLPTLLPEWEGDLAWQRILRDPTPSSALSRLVDAVDAEFHRDAEAFPEIKEGDFELPAMLLQSPASCKPRSTRPTRSTRSVRGRKKCGIIANSRAANQAGAARL